MCGLVRLPGGKPAPMSASSRGVGEVLAAAVDSGCTRVILGIGGSASTDGGAGLIRALGARVLDARGEEVPEGGAGLLAAESVDLSALRTRLQGVEIIVACDVDNPLTGPTGAAATYGPQKGASPSDVEALDRALDHWANLVAQTTSHEHGDPARPDLRSAHAAPDLLPAHPAGADLDSAHAAGRELRSERAAGADLDSAPRVDAREVPGAGAAGGVGFVVVGVLGGELRAGIGLVLELVGFGERLVGADLLVTGEGKLDEQTLRGKAVVGVAAAGAAAGVPVVAVCGANTLDGERLREAGIKKAYALTDLEPDVRRCIADPVPLLRLLGERIAADLR